MVDGVCDARGIGAKTGTTDRDSPILTADGVVVAVNNVESLVETMGMASGWERGYGRVCPTARRWAESRDKEGRKWVVDVRQSCMGRRQRGIKTSTQKSNSRPINLWWGFWVRGGEHIVDAEMRF